MTTSTIVSTFRTGADVRLSDGRMLRVAMRGDDRGGYLWAAELYSDGSVGAFRQLCGARRGHGPAWRGETVCYVGSRSNDTTLADTLELAGIPIYGRRSQHATGQRGWRHSA